ncbi:odorant receptor 46a-like [Apis dorsata]|uniref:odorant receptor 46a-like n=1 Tax=Apis dorsata TaxID=7462 RepID=UPI0012936F70|nr:odorant receptor 46a-like [Apis dorsata]
MQLLRTIYHFLTSCACWRPPFLSPLKNFAYTVYYCYVILLIYGATFCQFVDLLLIVETEDEFCDNFYLTLAIFISCHKMYSMLVNRENIILITSMLESKPFQPETEEEMNMRDKCDKQARLNAIYYAILVELSVMSLSFGGLLKTESHKLPYRMWLPYNYTSLSAYTFIYTQQVVSLIVSAMIHVACDSFIWALLMHICSQIEIFNCRLKKIKHEKNKVTKLCIHYHNLIYRLATTINEQFKMVIFVQFTVSTLTICVNLYILMGTQITIERIIQLAIYSSCMLTQIYIFCWYGNEVKLKSLDISNMIFELDWPDLDNTTKRDLLMIMMRASYPIEMTSVHVVAMNLDSFVILLKTSYSAYNLLQIFVRSFFTDFKKRKLTFRAWLPYDYSELLPFTLSYAHQATTSMFCSCQNISCDTLFGGFLVQIYCQFEILEERLKNVQQDESNYSAKQCVKHYHQIYKFSRTLNEKFKVILFLQFCAIAFILCFNLYRMTTITMIPKLLEASLYLIRVLVQILYYCWFSNEVKLKSLEVPGMIFKSDWTSWDDKTKKIFLIIMTRATQPFEFTSGYLVTLNLEFFVALIKASYSVFNLLQRTK